MGCIHSTHIFKKRSRKNDELDESKYDGVLRGVENHNINIEWKDTKPFVVPGGYLIIKLNEKKITKKNINLEEELSKIVQIKTNEQLNQFSNIFLNKFKKDIVINEL